ncbi:hypothetical protein [Caldisalinibacter kiritimatiensis]
MGFSRFCSCLGNKKNNIACTHIY